MYKKIFIFGSVLIGISLVLVMLITLTGKTQASSPLSPEVWRGVWQMGPDMDSTLWGGTAGEGLARFTGYYYTSTNRIYFLGGRREDNSTTGTIFYFDLGTRTYGSTGATVPTPVSNYIIARVDDDSTGHGPGLYIVGGRTGTGGQSNAVQVYYPNDNTVATIATDPYPASPLGSPGGVVAVDGKLYVFGGFTGSVMYAETYKYDPQAPTGSRWTNIGCNLPSPRSYIASAIVGHKIYAMGGDEFIASSLTPITDTVVLDTGNLGGCWQDGLMADLPSANGDAPAVFVNEGYLGGTGGGIFVVGGYWPPPGPFRWVFRYDIATDTWEDFPQLVIPNPASGRRNQAAVYVPASPTNGPSGLGNGVPGIWVFGGYDGSGTNAMTNSSEFFSITGGEVTLLPDQLQVTGPAGASVVHHFYLTNNTGSAETFNLSYTSDVTWTVTMPASVGPVGNGAETTFDMGINLPDSYTCLSAGVFTVTATSQTNPDIHDSQVVSARVECEVRGVIRDANTNLPITHAYVYVQNTPEGLDRYFDTYTNDNGEYTLTNLPPDVYLLATTTRYYQPSFYPSGWPTGSISVDFAITPDIIDINLVGSNMSWTPMDGFNVNLYLGGSLTQTLTITNSGTGPLVYNLNVVDGSQPTPPPAEAAVPGLPRLDPQLYEDLAASPNGKADFVVVLAQQADLNSSYAIKDWNTRGQFVYNTLRTFADSSQRGLRSFLDSRSIAYTPLYIINGVIVKGGDLNLVDSLAARTDVAQIIANHRIPVETERFSWVEQLLTPVLVPETIEWNISKVNANLVWTTYGVKGEGIVVAEIDTGTQWDHPALKSHYRGWNGVTPNHNYNWFDPYGQSPTVPHDLGAHGTHVMGTMVGDDGGANQIGVAPGAKWISCKGGDDVSGYLLTNELLECAQWILAPTDLTGHFPDPTKRPNVVNNSWGGGPNDYWYTGAVSAWSAAGIFPAFANGNAGPNCSTAHSPGDNWNAFAAGASDISDNIAGFSSRGPALYTGILKPDITAPGANIRSSVPTNSYANYNGTSMASPHVAGVVALLWSADPELKGQVDLTGWILQQSAKPFYTTQGCGGDTPTSHPNNVWGYGLLDVYKAVTTARAGGVTSDWVKLSSMGGVVLPGASTSIDVGLYAPVVSGTYTATLWLVADDPYNNDVRLPITLKATPPPPQAGFTSNSPVILGETAVFTDTSTGSGPFTYLWNFGDGTTSNLQKTTHLYTEAKTYTVTLTITTPWGTDEVTHDFVVLVFKVYLPFVSK
jgi:subtilisin family serine protease